MTKEKLERYQMTIRSIAILKEEINEMETMDAGIASDIVLDYRSGMGIPTRIEGFQWPLYNRRKAELARLLAEEKEVREFVEAIPDHVTRQVFKLRVYRGMEWRQIAKQIGEKDECYPRRYIFDKYLKKSKSTVHTENTVVQ